jgi:Ca-activated chloride channel homolog
VPFPKRLPSSWTLHCYSPKSSQPTTISRKWWGRRFSLRPPRDPGRSLTTPAPDRWIQTNSASLRLGGGFSSSARAPRLRDSACGGSPSFACGYAALRLCVSAVYFCLLGSSALSQQPPVIRVNVNLVRVVATVKNLGDELVGSLDQDDFEIYDNGKRQQVAVFERQTAQPLSVAVLIDTSGSTAKELKHEVESVNRFLKTLFGEGNPADTAALYSFNWEVRRHNYFTRNLPSLDKSLRSLKGEAGTALYDAVFLASGELENRDGRRVIVIVTDGGDTTSSKKFHDALEAAQLADAVIYPIVVMPITNDAGRNIGGENALTLMARGTGGRTFLPSVGAQLDAAFTDIIRELRTQYLLGFYPRDVPLTKNRFHSLQVKAKRPDLRVLARNGYYGEAEGRSEMPGARISVAPDLAPRKK